MTKQTRLEQIHLNERKNRIGIDSLQIEKVSSPREMLPSSIDAETVKPSSFEIERREFLKQKFGIKGNALEFQGLLGARLAANEMTVAEAVNADARQRREAGNFHLATAKTIYQGKPVRLFFELSI